MSFTLTPPPLAGSSRAGRNRLGSRRALHQRQWAVTASSLLAVLAAATGLQGVIEGWDWFLPAAVTLAPALVVAALARAFRLPGVVAAAIGLLALTGALTARFLPQQALLGFIPGPGAGPVIQNLLRQAEKAVLSQMAPVAPDPGLLLVICAALGLTGLIVDGCATTLRRPGLAGLALLPILAVPAVVEPDGVGVGPFAVTVAAFLLLLASAQWREDITPWGPWQSAGYGAVIGSAALAMTLVLPLTVPGFTSGVFPQGTRPGGWGSAAGLDPTVTLGNDLRTPSGGGRITYATNSDTPLYLRAVTLEDFEGSRWEPDQRGAVRRDGLDQIGAGQGLPAASPDTVTTRVQTPTSTSPWLLAPYAPVNVSGATGRWSWDPDTLSLLTADGQSTAGQDYLVRSAQPDLTRAALASSGPVDPSAVKEVFTTLPVDTPDIVTSTTVEVTGGSTTPYDRALAIQDYLRGPGFRYSLDAPVDGGYDGSSMEVMARFLESRSGYCVHYAGTMAVMARAAGIPSRVAVGYSPGTSTGETERAPDGTELREFAVDARDAHAWPELYFEGAGWVQFEPTPSRGTVPAYAQQPTTPNLPPAEDVGVLDPAPFSTKAAEPEPVQETADAAPADSGAPVSREAAIPAAAGLAAAAAFALLALPCSLRRLRTGIRRRSITVAGTAGAPGAARTAWAEITDTASDYGHGLLPADTPRTFSARLAEEAELNHQAAASLVRLAQLHERAEYAGPNHLHRRNAAETVLQPIWEEVRLVTAALRRRSTWGHRLKAVILPLSLRRHFTWPPPRTRRPSRR